MLKLLKVMATTGGGSIVTMLLGLATNKVVAVVLGPSGVGLLASYRVIQDTVTGLGTLGGTAAQVQALSSVEGEARQRRLSACVWLTLTGMAIFTAVLLLGAPAIAEHFFRDPSPDIVLAVRCMVVTFCVSIAGLIAVGFVNVSGAIGWLVMTQIVVSTSALVAAWPLARLAGQGFQLGYVALIFVPLIVQLMLGTVMCWRLGWLPQIGAALRRAPHRDDMLHFLNFFVANLGGGLISSACMLALRATIIETDGQHLNGLFQASWTLTQQNLTLLVSSFGIYLLPKLASTHDPQERRIFLNDALPLVIVLTVPMAGVGLLFMPLVLRILYSAEFLPAIEPLRWMLLGNLSSALISLYVNLLLARGRPMTSAVTEVGWYIGFSGTGMALLTGHVDPAILGVSRLEALGLAFFVFNTLRLVSLIVFCRHAIPYFPSAYVWRIGGTCAAMLAIAAWIGWSAHEVNWFVSLPAAVGICAAPLLLLNRQRFDQLRSMLRARLAR
ncbi:MAG: oligosaccharide flippase family protein [Alphaproteobacteria bacterium]|nr:oligosaccharide flippase family protein [Alphaproteobacteria bacterium]